MTDYSFQAVGDSMAKIMDNAIQMYLTEFGWWGTWDEGFQGQGWNEMLPGKSHVGTLEMTYTAGSSYGQPAEPPPGCTYLGEEIVDNRYVYRYDVDPGAIWDWIVERINTAFRGWRSLPDPADFDRLMGYLEDAVDEVTPDDQGEGEYSFVNVDVGSAMGRIHTWVSPDGGGNGSGDLLYAFDAAYGADRISGVMTNQAQIAAGLGFTVAGERELWTKARADIMRIADDAAKAFDVTGGGDFNIDLGVVKAFVDLAGVFAPAQFKVLTEAASAGIGLLEAVTPKPTTEAKELLVSGGTTEEIMSSMEKAIRDLEWAIYGEENELVSRLDRLRDALVERSATDFHVHPDRGIDPDFAAEAELRINSTAVQRVGHDDVPVVAAAFLRAAQVAATETGEGAWTRDNSIGYGTSGPHARWSSMIDEFDALATGTAKELIDAGERLAVAAGWVRDSDTEAELQSQGLLDELNRGELQYTRPGQ